MARRFQRQTGVWDGPSYTLRQPGPLGRFFPHWLRDLLVDLTRKSRITMLALATALRKGVLEAQRRIKDLVVIRY